MNDEITSLGLGATDKTDVTGNTHITDFTQVVSCAVGRDRQERRRQRIREELVRDHFAQESASSPTAMASPSIRNRLLKLLKFN